MYYLIMMIHSVYSPASTTTLKCYVPQVLQLLFNNSFDVADLRIQINYNCFVRKQTSPRRLTDTRAQLYRRDYLYNMIMHSFHWSSCGARNHYEPSLSSTNQIFFLLILVYGRRFTTEEYILQLCFLFILHFCTFTLLLLLQ